MTGRIPLRLRALALVTAAASVPMVFICLFWTAAGLALLRTPDPQANARSSDELPGPTDWGDVAFGMLLAPGAFGWLVTFCLACAGLAATAATGRLPRFVHRHRRALNWLAIWCLVSAGLGFGWRILELLQR